MDKYITANFFNVDFASMAANKVTASLSDVKSVTVSYKNKKLGAKEIGFSTLHNPIYGINSTIGFGGNPPMMADISMMSDRRADRYQVGGSGAVVKIKADHEQVSRICSILRNGGGLGITVD